MNHKDKAKKMDTDDLIKLFKDTFEDETGSKIDFRKHQYLQNNYGLIPVFSYSFAESVMSSLYRWANAFINEHQDQLRVTGIDYNLVMACDALRMSKLTTEIEKVCRTISSSYI